MQKWCPEPFDLAEPTAPSVARPAAGFETDPTDVGSAQFLFRSESGFVDQEALMGSLTRAERSQIFELVELEVADVYTARETVLKAEHQAILDQMRTEHETALAGLGTAVETTLGALRQDMAAASARLAVQLAEKIVRATVKIDAEVLVRNLETTLFKVHGSGPVSVDVNPTDAQWLAEHPEILEKLQIITVNRDRRIEAGGGLVRAGSHTWDATLGSQLETLSEVVEEMIATAEPTPIAPAPETPDEPGLD